MRVEINNTPPSGGGGTSKSSCMKCVSRVAMFVTVFAVLFAVMMWDMRKAHMLSTIIHDDHAQQWYAVGQDDLLSWWSPLDVCMMGMSSPSMTYAGYRNKNCSRLAASRGSRKLHLSCGAGASLGGSVCQPPFDSRWYFKAALRYDGLGDPHNQFLKTALRRYAQRNRPIIFIGDGISKQNQEALLCEILRTDDVVLSGKSGSIDGNYSIHWPNTHIPPLDVHYLKLTAMNDNGVPKEGAVPSSTTRLRRKMQRKRAVRVLDGVNSTDASVTNKTLTSRPAPPISPLSLTLDEIKDRVQGLMQNHTSGVVLVVNVGVWYNSRELFRTELPDLLSWMDGLSRNHNSTVLFRETAAQHWNHTESGYFDQTYVEQQYDNGTCTPVLDATPGEPGRATQH